MKGLLLFLLLANSHSLFANNDSLLWIKKDLSRYSLSYTTTDSAIKNVIENDLKTGVNNVSAFFKKEFIHKFDVYIFPDRAALNEQWRKDWNMPSFNSECWMVASGVAERLDVLSPQRWNKEACEHNGNDSTEVQRIITHELTHVFHAQYCANHTFDSMDDYAWLIEGVATYVSGQLTEAKIKSVKDNIAEGKAPEKLADFWKGKVRYQQAGSLIKFIDEKYGREKLFTLLKLTSQDEMMKTLGTNEKELIAGWKDFYK